MLFDFARKSGYQERRLEPGVLDFTFGDPHEMPQPAYVEALRDAAVPQDELWFAYKFSLVDGAGGCCRVAAPGRRPAVDGRPDPDDHGRFRRDHPGDEVGGRPR